MLRELRLRDFRCFEDLVFAPETGRNFVVGANAQGKTSLLEAACVLLRLQSPRAGSLAEAVRFGTEGFGLAGWWKDRRMQVKFTGALKAFALDSLPQSRSAEYLAVGHVVWISNDDLLLVRGSSAHRRRYLDFLGSQVVPNYLRTLRAYERALRSRNALLKDDRPRREIESFNAPLIEAGDFLLAARAVLCQCVAPRAAQAYAEISGGAEILAIRRHPGSPENFAAALEASRAEESRLRATVVGPHRDDVEILLDGQKTASFASEGQQRSIALALKLSQARELAARTEAPPLYLIDDVFGELDPQRRNNLLSSLPQTAQSLITATFLDWITDDETSPIFRMAGGALARSR